MALGPGSFQFSQGKEHDLLGKQGVAYRKRDQVENQTEQIFIPRFQPTGFVISREWQTFLWYGLIWILLVKPDSTNWDKGIEKRGLTCYLHSGTFMSAQNSKFRCLKRDDARKTRFIGCDPLKTGDSLSGVVSVHIEDKELTTIDSHENKVGCLGGFFLRGLGKTEQGGWKNSLLSLASIRE